LPLCLRQQEVHIQLLRSLRPRLRKRLDLSRLRIDMVSGVRVDQPVLLQEGMPVHIGVLMRVEY
jgi:hypothetical protein